VDRKLAEALYAVGLVIILLVIARLNPAVGTSMLLLAATMGDIRVVRKSASTKKMSTKPGLLGRTLRRVGGQIIVLGLLLLDIGGLGFALAAPVWLAPWVIINLTTCVVGTLSWNERQREAQRLQQFEQAERLRQAEQRLKEVEQLQRQEEERREAQRQQQEEQAERLRRAEQQLREAEWRRRLDMGANRKRAQFQADWWVVLGIAPSASKDEIVRKYRRMIKQYHPDRVTGLAPEFVQLAEERTKELNEACANATRTRLLHVA
jgi:DnaJ-domain-containing protein 1